MIKCYSYYYSSLTLAYQNVQLKWKSRNIPKQATWNNLVKRKHWISLCAKTSCLQIIHSNYTINLEAMGRSGAKRNETFRGSHEIHRSDTVSAKTNGSKSSSLFEKIGNITSTS